MYPYSHKKLESVASLLLLDTKSNLLARATVDPREDNIRWDRTFTFARQCWNFTKLHHINHVVDCHSNTITGLRVNMPKRWGKYELIKELTSKQNILKGGLF